MSPHLIKYNERISVQNKNITDSEMEDLINRIEPKIQKYNSQNDMKVTLFELETTMSLIYFKEQKCDFVVLETGLGGLYDCTNIVTPLISVITSIGCDHMNILGNSLVEIAKQKAGIIKPNSKTVFAISDNEEVNDIIVKTCNEKNNKLYIVDSKNISNYSYDNKFQKFDYKNYKNIVINLKGKKQLLNSSIVIECCEVLNNMGYKILESNLRDALKAIIHKARFEELYKKPIIIFDGAHNEPAIANFKESVNMYYKNNEKVFIISILKTKDYKSILKELLKDEKSIFIFTDGNSKELYVSKDELLKTAKEYTKNKDLYTKALEDAIDFSIENYKEKVVFFVGSFYIYGNVVEKLND